MLVKIPRVHYTFVPALERIVHYAQQCDVLIFITTSYWSCKKQLEGIK